MASSSFSLCSSLILCIICAFLTIQSTSNPLIDLCTKSKYFYFCLSVLKDHSHQNLRVLTQLTINLATSNAFATKSKINLLQNQMKNPNVEAIYKLCANDYNRIVVILGNAQQYFNMDQWKNLITATNNVIEDAFNCETTFHKRKPGYVSNITKENEDLQKLGDIIVTAADLFLIWFANKLRWNCCNININNIRIILLISSLVKFI